MAAIVASSVMGSALIIVPPPGACQSGGSPAATLGVTGEGAEMVDLWELKPGDVITLHDGARSRSIFRAIFAGQYRGFVPRSSLGLSVFQFLPCQKSPSQKTATRARLNTMSGLPGSEDT
jgi:hypothetical protein